MSDKILTKFDELVQEMTSLHEAHRLLNERVAELNKNEKFLLQQQQMYVEIGNRSQYFYFFLLNNWMITFNNSLFLRTIIILFLLRYQ